MNKVVIKAENISKQYRLGLVGTGTIKDDMKRWWYKLRGADDPFLKIGEANDRTSKGESDYVWSLRDINFEINQGDSVGIIGRNGIGKTTFLNIITGDLSPDKGKLDHGETVVYGYYQQQGPMFKPGQRVIDIIQEIAEVINMGDGRQLTVTQFLNLFLFTTEMQYVQVEKLSGGEKRRLYLMTVLIRNPNFLILDEPTNDFDIVTLNVLEEYLLNFKGCLIIVSHDRFFMDKIVDHLFIFEGAGVVYDFPGNYSDYHASQKQQESELRRIELQNKSNTQAETDKKTDLRAKKKFTFKEKKEFEELSTEIESLEKEKSALEIALNSGSLKPDELNKGSRRITEIITLIDEKTDRWLELSE
jgi:ATP-binding cassette subfamily F protein uup